MFTRVALLGSRNLAPQYAPLVTAVVAALVAAGVRSFSTCCGRGACAFARSALAAARVQFAVFAASSFPASSYAGTLSLRSAACVRGVVGGAVVAFLSSPDSRGTCREMCIAAALGIPVFAFACGFPPALLPLVGSGQWSPAPGALGALGAFKLETIAQPSLFL